MRIKHLRRRDFITLLGGAAAWPLAARAQQRAGAQKRIGFLSLESSAGSHPDLDAFRAGLADLGYVEGRNLVIEYRMADYREDVLPRLAAELVELKVAIIVALAPPAIMAAKAATTTIPIVMRTTIDPIKAEFVASMARPGGNVTGVSSVSGSLYGKRLDLLKELVPGLTHIGMIWNPRSPTAADYTNLRNDRRSLHIMAGLVQACPGHPRL